MTAKLTIGLTYPKGFDDAIGDDLQKELEPHGIALATRRTETTAYAGIVWLLPTIVVVFITHEFFSGFFKEAGKDAYTAVKRGVVRVWERVAMRYRVTELASSPGKLSVDSYSRLFSGFAKSHDGSTIKLLLRDDASADGVSAALDAFLTFVEAHNASKASVLTFRGGVAVVAYDSEAKQLYEPAFGADSVEKSPKRLLH